MDVRAEMLVFFSKILTALTEVLGRDIRANDPWTSVGCPSQKLPLWADFSFLKCVLKSERERHALCWGVHMARVQLSHNQLDAQTAGDFETNPLEDDTMQWHEHGGPKRCHLVIWPDL